ncbi:hypothetical protein [Streptomyces sp. NPDC020681]|uniref:hypothetical protein n=1 Tax=Streptomyces sp. NPDC020681 TaxID=3365083 RepID=UPI003787E350
MSHGTSLDAGAGARHRARPEQCLLIDDTAVNCAAARRRGWTAVGHLDTARTITDLARVAR